MLKGMLGTLMQALAEREPPAPPTTTTLRDQALHTAVAQVEPATVHGLTSYPPVEKWNDWVEYDPKAWPRKVPRRYTLVPTVCFNCESACGLLGYVDKDTLTIQKFEGNPLHPGSRGRNCAKGPATLNQVYDPDRILYPLKRAGARGEGKWRRVSWDEALDDIAGRIR
jgi:anaerobic selenocysteine-containing dehydrogenase